MFCIQRIVIKIGSAVLTNKDKTLNTRVLEHLAKQILELYQEGHQILIVTSGAVAAGRGFLDFSSERRRQVRRQMYAGIGQALVMSEYHKIFDKKKIPISQMLITRDNFADRKEFANLMNTLEGYLRFRVIPIINENDIIDSNGINFGGNDFLAALTAVAIKADKLIFLSDIDALYDKDPQKYPDAKKIHVVDDVSEKVLSMGTVSNSDIGLGGMSSKLRAIKIAADAGIKTFLGKGEGILHKLVDTKHHVGTYFKPREAGRPHRFQHWLKYCAIPKGIITIDDGAAVAVNKRKSLLMVGVLDVTEGINANDMVCVSTQKGEKIGIGKIRYGSEDIKDAMRKKKNIGVIIHSNHLTIR